MMESPDPAVNAQPEKKSHAGMHASLAVMGGGQLADGLSTIAALKRPNTAEGNSGVYGKNPSAARILGTKAAVTLPLIFALERLSKEHPKLAQGLALGIGGLGAGLAVRNSQVGK